MLAWVSSWVWSSAELTGDEKAEMMSCSCKLKKITSGFPAYKKQYFFFLPLCLEQSFKGYFFVLL